LLKKEFKKTKFRKLQGH